MDLARVVASLEAQLEKCAPPCSEAALYAELRLHALRGFALKSARDLGLVRGDQLPAGRLFDGSVSLALCDAFAGEPALGPEAAAAELGALLEALLGHELSWREGRLRLLPTRVRKKSGSFYTPAPIASALVDVSREGLRSTPRWPRVRICDPSVGAGAASSAAPPGSRPPAPT